jgi:hypothetical protein
VHVTGPRIAQAAMLFCSSIVLTTLKYHPTPRIMFEHLVNTVAII